MILSGKEIEARLDKDIVITPFNKKQLNPNSYNLRLGRELMVYDEELLDMKKTHKTINLNKNCFIVFHIISTKLNAFFSTTFKCFYTVQEERFMQVLTPVIYGLDDIFVADKFLSTT